MSNTGITINDNKNFIVIDDNYRNLVFKKIVNIKSLKLDTEKYYIRDFSNWNGAPAKKCVADGYDLKSGIPGNSMAKAITINSNSFVGIGPLSEILKHNIQIHMTKGVDGKVVVLIPQNATDVNLFAYYFDWNVEQDATEKSGLKIYDKNGNLVYENTNKYLQIIANGTAHNSIPLKISKDFQLSKVGVLFSSLMSFEVAQNHPEYMVKYYKYADEKDNFHRLSSYHWYSSELTASAVANLNIPCTCFLLPKIK